MRIGIAADHGGFELKEGLVAYLREAAQEVVDVGALSLNPDGDYPDFVTPPAQMVAAGNVERGVAVCGSAVGAAFCADKTPGFRAGLIHVVTRARQGVEDDPVNILHVGGRTTGPAVAKDVVDTFLQPGSARPSGRSTRLRRMAASESQVVSTKRSPAGSVMSARKSNHLSDRKSISSAHQRHSQTLNRCGATRHAWPPGTADGACAPGLHNPEARDEIRSGRSDLAQRDRFLFTNGHASMLYGPCFR